MTAGWTIYGAHSGMAAIAGLPGAPTLPISFYLALFTDNANPDAGTTTEYTLTSYERQAITLTAGSDGALTNADDIEFDLAEGSTLAGCAGMDAATDGNAWWYDNLDAAVSVQAGIIVLAGQLQVGVLL